MHLVKKKRLKILSVYYHGEVLDLKPHLSLNETSIDLFITLF